MLARPSGQTPQAASPLEPIQQDPTLLFDVLGSISDGLIVIDPDQRVQYCNVPAAEFLSVRPQDILGQTMSQAFGRVSRTLVNRKEAREAWDRALAQLDERPRFEVVISEPVRRDLVVQLFPLKAVDGKRNAGVLIHDVSVLKRVALLEERERIAMDLHDGVIQSLYAVGLGIAAKERALKDDIEQAREALRQSMTQINDVIQEVRTYIGELRPDDLRGTGLVAGLVELTGRLRANGLLCPQLDLDPAVAYLLSAESTASVLYIAQEAISNVMRHAEASAASVSATTGDGLLRLTISDDGRGFDPQRTGRRVGDGLRNMVERARSLGGQISVESAAGSGTTIRLEVPISTEDRQP